MEDRSGRSQEVGPHLGDHGGALATLIEVCGNEATGTSSAKSWRPAANHRTVLTGQLRARTDKKFSAISSRVDADVLSTA
jgi:hypothetical protein